MVRNRYSRLLIIALALILLWTRYLLFDASSKSSQLPHRHLKQKNIEKVNFMVDQVFKIKRSYKENNANKKFDDDYQTQNQTLSTVAMLDKLERVVHIDLKGAHPKPDYYKTFIPFIKEHGATGK